MLIFLLVVGAFFVGSKPDYEETVTDETTDIYTTEEDSMAKAELVGVWWAGFYDANTKESISGNIISFDDNGEINLICLDKQMLFLINLCTLFLFQEIMTVTYLNGKKIW